jgi:uncharacterized SAM-binding protein YcdF (DUF218 family)
VPLPDSPTASPAAAAPKAPHGSHLRLAVGCLSGLLLAWGGAALGLDALPPFFWVRFPLVVAALGFLIGRSRRRWVPGACAAIAALPWLALLLITTTPVMGSLGRALAPADPLRPAAAIVVLSSDIRPDGTPDRGMQWRLDHAYGLVRAGYARRLSLPRLAIRDRSYLPAVRRQLTERGLRCEVEEIGPVHNTHDEVLRVAALARRPERQPLILVSEGMHLRRVTALCRKAGVSIIRSPSPYGEFDYQHPGSPRERLAAFRVWLHEVYLFETNRLQGWL